jgi:hypothetical protein
MNRFISVNNLIKDTGYSFSCDKKIFVTKYFEHTRVICSSVNTSILVDVLTDKPLAIQSCAMNPEKPLLYTGGYSSVDENIVWKGTDGVQSKKVSWSAGFDIKGFYRKEVYFTDNTVGSSLLRPKSNILATSKTEPLALYISSDRDSLVLAVYDFETNIDTLIKEITSESLLNEDVINSCKAYFGRFNSKKQHDIFINCSVMGFNNHVLFKSESYNNTLQLPFGCLSTDKLQIIDINGDKYSDILCIKSQLVIVNNKGDFIRALPLEGIDDFTQFFDSQNIHFGDFNGDGIQDLFAITSQKIALGTLSNKYISKTITLNGLNNWCSSGNVIVADFDQDEKDDLLCQEDNKAFILLSRNNIPLSQSSSDSKKMLLTLDNFVFGLYGEHRVTDKEIPVICDASHIEDTNTKIGCALIGKNSVLSISTPILPSQSIRDFRIFARIKSSYDLFANNINVKNSENELINPESGPESDQEVFYDMIAPNSASVRYFDTSYSRYYYRDNLISAKTLDHSKHTFPHLITAGVCNNLYFNYTVITTVFSAEAKLQLFDDKNNVIIDRTLLDKHFQLFASGNITGKTINADSVSFFYSGSIILKTPYKKTVTYCGEKIEFADNIKKQTKSVASTETTCTLEKAKITFDDTKSILALKREEVIKMNGYIHLGFGIFPFISTGSTTSAAISNAINKADISAQNLKNFPNPGRGEGDQTAAQNLINTLNNDGLSLDNIFNNEVTQIEDNTVEVSDEVKNINKFFAENNQYENSYSSVIFNTGLKMIAYIKNTDKCPKREINFKIFKNHNDAVAISDISPYAAFDNIEKVRLEAFGKSVKDLLKVALLWSVYVAHKSQFFVFVDYLNTGNALLRIAAFDSNFKVISHSENEVNTLIIAYRKSKDTLSVFKTYADLGGFRPAKSIDIDLEGNGDIEYDIKKSTSNSFYLIKHYKNNKGIFIQKYDFSLNEMGVEHNIQANPNQICISVYDNSMVVVWLEKKDLDTLYIQVFQDNLIIKRTKLCEINGEILIQDVQIQTSTQDSSIYSLPNVGILVSIDNIKHVMSFDENLRITNIKKINYPGQVINKDITNQAISNILQNNQAEIKQAIKMTETIDSCSNHQSYFEQKLEEITKQDFQNDNNFFIANSDAIKSFITYGGQDSNNSPNYESENGNIELSYGASDILKAKSTLRIYNGNIDATSKLNLNFQHNSYVLNADWTQKHQLEDALEYIDQGINRAINALNKNNNAASTTISKLLCKSTATPDTIRNLLISFKGALSAKTIYNFIEDTASTKCQNQNFYPVYKEGVQVNICPSYTNRNLYTECNRVLQLASLTKHELTTINQDAVLKLGAYSSNIVQHIYDIYNGNIVDTYNSCINTDPYKPGSSIVHHLARSIIVGMITTEPKKTVATTECSSMANDECSEDGMTQMDNICLSDYIYANSMLYLFEHSTDYQINSKENCNRGCELSSPALSSLLSEVRANVHPLFTTNDLLNTTLLPNLTVATTRSVNYTVESYEAVNNATNQTTGNITRVENVTDVKELSVFNESAYKDIYDINTFSTVNFRDKNLAYISSILQGSGFYEIRGQFFKMPSQKPYGLEMSLGRFENIKQLKVSAYSEKTLLVAFSTQSLDTKYNILVNVLTQNNSRILNIYPSIDGNFDIRTILASQDFIVSYAEDYTTFVTKKYTITGTKIIEKFKTEKTLQNDKSVFTYISEFITGVFDVIWNGYYKQTITTDGNLESSINKNSENIENYAATSNTKLITVATQTNSNINIDSFNIVTQNIQSSHTLDIKSWRLHTAQYVSADIVVFTLSAANNTLQRLVLNVTNKELLQKDFFYFIGQDFVAAKLVDTINNGTQLFEKEDVTEFDDLISAMHQCEYVLSGKNLNNPIYSNLMVKENASEYLSVLKGKMPEKQSKALDEALAMQQNYSLNNFYKNLNLTSNSAACIVDTGLKENFYSQMSGYADAADFIETANFSSLLGLV